MGSVADKTKAVLATKMTSPLATKMAIKKRSGVSFDTGTQSGKDSRYQAIKGEISAGRLKPSTHQLRKHWQCNYETAAAYLSALHQEGLLDRNEANGQYTLVKFNVTDNKENVKNDVTLNREVG